MLLQTTIRVFYRPTARCSLKSQQIAASKFPGRVIPYENMDEWFSHMRRGNMVGVPFFHVLATGADELAEVRQRLKAAGVTVLEIDTGREIVPGHDGDVVAESLAVYARRGMTKAQAARIGKLGALASPATKSRGDRLPIALAEEILNNHELYPTQFEALRAINNAKDVNGKKFKGRWYPSYISRLANPPDGSPPKINLKPRKPGPKPTPLFAKPKK